MHVRPAALVVLALTATLSLAAEAHQEDVPIQTMDDPVQPPSPAPSQPPPPPRQFQAPPPAQAEAPAQAPVPGQWVYTDQYGWIWMPYGDRYTHLAPGDEPPDMYVYQPSYGWCWVSAPWIWGWGPLPFFGVPGTVRFGWWGNGFGHWYGFSGRHRSWGRAGWDLHRGWEGRPGGWSGRPGEWTRRPGGWTGRPGGWEGRPRAWGGPRGGGGFRHSR